MRPFSYIHVAVDAEAVRAGAAPGAAYLAGGTTLVDLAKLDVMHPASLVDVNALQARHGKVSADAGGLRLGAFARMAEAAENPAVVSAYPVVAQSLQLAASPQIRNMASLGGNVLQRTRCTYFRDVTWAACNKRSPGSGCSAIGGNNRGHAVLGTSDACIAMYPGDFATALAALEATVELTGPGGPRVVPFEALHTLPGAAPNVETTLKPGELITGFHVPAGPWTKRSMYLKIRDRASFEFAAASAAVALDLDGGRVRAARIGLGGVAAKPWRSREAEAALVGQQISEQTAAAAADAAFSGARGHGHNDYKLKLGRRTLVRALLETARMEG